MIPLRFLYGNHKQISALATISITPSSISTAHVLDFLIPNT